jgi:hypothetical protein
MILAFEGPMELMRGLAKDGENRERNPLRSR